MSLILEKKETLQYAQVPGERGTFTPDAHLYAVRTSPSFVTVSASTPPTNLFSGGGSNFSMQIPVNSLSQTTSVQLRFGVTVANAAVTAMPTPWWCTEIEVRAVEGDRVVATLTPEHLWMGAIANLRTSQLQTTLHNMNAGWEEHNLYDRAPPLEVGTHTLYLPLNGFIFNQKIFLSNLKDGKLILVLKPRTNILISGSSANLTLNSISLLFQNDGYADEKDRLITQATLGNRTLRHNFLEVVRCSTNNVTLAASTKYDLDLSNINGRACAFGLLNILPTGASATDDGLRDCHSLGRAGTVDITTASGESKFAHGVPIPVRALQEWALNQHSLNDFFEEAQSPMFIPFCESMQLALRGSMVGGFREFGTKDLLSITPDIAAVSEVQRLTATAQPAAGYFRISFDGSLSDPLAYNTSAANLKVAFDALPSALRNNIVATFSAALSAGTTVDVTLVNPTGQMFGAEQRIQIVNHSLQTGAAAPIGVTTTVTTKGYPGFVNDGPFDITFHAFCFRSVDIYPDGDLKSVNK